MIKVTETRGQQAAEGRAAGFTLLEMSIVLVIIAIVLGGGMTIFSASLQKRQLQETQSKLQAIQTALYNYRITNNRIPCPADVTLAITDQYFGVEGVSSGACTTGSTYDGTTNARTAAASPGPTVNFSNGNNVEGMVPTNTLRLPDDYAIDGWGRRIMYAVDKRYTASSGFTTNTISATGNLKVTTGGPPVGGGSSSTSATFVTTDTSTQGNWVGVYGSDGLAIEADTSSPSYPSYATVSVVGNSNYTWSNPSVDVRALQEISSHSTRQASCWYQNSYYFDVNIAGGTSQVSLYALDWDDYLGGRSERIDVEDANTSAVLDTRTVSSFVNGQYYVWTISGHVQFVITNLVSGANAVISGIFFDNFAAAGPPNYNPAVYALVSFGPNGHGAYPRNGGSTRISTGSTNTDELNNCDCDHLAAPTGLDGVFIQKAATQDPATPRRTNDFDDLVVYATRSQLTSTTE